MHALDALEEGLATGWDPAERSDRLSRPDITVLDRADSGKSPARWRDAHCPSCRWPGSPVRARARRLLLVRRTTTGGRAGHAGGAAAGGARRRHAGLAAAATRAAAARGGTPAPAAAPGPAAAGARAPAARADRRRRRHRRWRRAAPAPAAGTGGTFGISGPTRCDSTLPLCESFENGLDGNLWKTTKAGDATITVDDVHAARGTKALHVKTAAGGGSNFAYIKETKTFPATNNVLYGRMFVWFEDALTTDGHFSLAEGAGTGTPAVIRFGGQFKAFGVGTDGGAPATGPTATGPSWSRPRPGSAPSSSSTARPTPSTSGGTTWNARR